MTSCAFHIMQDWNCSLAFFVTLLLSIMISGVEISSPAEEIQTLTCIQNCSWRSYDRDTSNWVENRCEITNPGNDIDGCPSIYPVSDSTNSHPSQVKQFDVSYYTTTKASDTSRSVLCANVTFKVGRPAVDLVKGIRLTLIGKTYNDLNNHYCVVWDMKTKLSFCSVSSNNCSINDNVRMFHYDCFCGLTPGSGLLNSHEGYLVSVDTLPKLTEQHQEFRLFPVPGCQDFPTNEHCPLTPKEKWRPLFSSLEQLCNFSSINVTFDLPPMNFEVKKIGVFLYNKVTYRLVWQEPFLKVRQLRTYERILFNTTYNITSLVAEDLDLNSSYIIGTKIQDRDGGKRYMTKRISSTSIFLRNPPCSTNPCPKGEVCIEDCLSYTCECDTETMRIRGECQVPWYPKGLQIISHKSTHKILFAESPPHYSRIGKYSIGLFTSGLVEYVNAQTSVDPDGPIYASFNNLEASKTYTPAVRIADECPRCEYKFYNSSQFAVATEGTRTYTIIAYISPAVLPILLFACLIWHCVVHRTSKGSSNARHFPEGVRLICSPNPHLQNFTNKLRQLLQENVQLGCLVSVETLNDTTQEGIAHWLAEAKKNGDRICFILDHNLSILDFGESQVYWMKCKVHSIVDSVLLDELISPVLLKFDFIPTESPPDSEQGFVISLPSGLNDLVKELNAGADLSSLRCDCVLDAYVKMKNILEQKMCHSSMNEWTKLARNMDEEESLGSGFICQSVLTLDEEDATFELIETTICNPPKNI